MTLPTYAGTPSGPKPDENERYTESPNPVVTTPQRKITSQSQTTTPITPKSKANTPLHKRFLQEVTMSPSKPPRTPSHSPKKAGEEKLEVGQNGFYFSMEIPEKKIVSSRPASRAATPNAKPSGRLTPSPEKRNGRLTPGRLSPSPKKELRSEVKGTPSGGGRVRDILRKNLFGTPTKKATTPGWRNKDECDVKMSPTKNGAQMSGGARSENPMVDATIGRITTLSAPQKLDLSAHCSAQPASALAPDAPQELDLLADQCHTPKTTPFTLASAGEAAPPFGSRKASTASTPFNIGHLMANHSSKSARVLTPPAVSGLESMPTPLRKMSERLGLKSLPVAPVERDDERESKIFVTVPAKGLVISPISTLPNKHIATAQTNSLSSPTADKSHANATPVASYGGYDVRKENRLTQLLPSPITVPSPTLSSRPNTATTPSYPSPLTPCRPGLSSRSKSFGTPAVLRSSMQEDMFKVQESLKRSLGQEAFQKTASRPATPKLSETTVSRTSTPATDRSTSTVKRATRPLSVVGPPKPNAMGTTQAVPRRPLNTATRKPRPKSMVVGSAKVLEIVASQIDSPRERAKLRSTAAATPAHQSGGSVPRSGTATWTSRGFSQAATARKPVGAQPLARTVEPPALRNAAQLKRAALHSPTAVSGPTRQRVVSAEVIADRIAAWHKEDTQKAAPKPAAKLPVRSKSVKTLNKPTFRPAANAAARPATRPTSERVSTPEPKNTKADSGTAQSFTPPGLPTQLPMSPSKKLLVAPTAPAPSRTASKDARKQRLQNAHRNAPPPSAAAQLRTPVPAKTPARTPANKRHTWVGGLDEGDANVFKTPSKEVQSRLDEAIDRKILEDRRRAGWI